MPVSAEPATAEPATAGPAPLQEQPLAEPPPVNAAVETRLIDTDMDPQDGDSVCSHTSAPRGNGGNMLTEWLAGRRKG